MATIVATASGGTRNWSDTATWTGGVLPTAADDVQLSGTSGNVSITNGALCRSLDCTGYTATLTHNVSAALTIGDATAGAGNVALKLVAGMTYTIGGAVSSSIVFASTSATTQTITWAGKTAPTVTINGAGGVWQVQDTWTAPVTTLTLTAGTLDTNGQTCSWSVFSSAGASTRTLTMGASAITLGQASGGPLSVSSTLTVTANTATMTLSGASPTITSNSVNWNGMSMVVSGSGVCIVAVGTFNNFTRTGTAVKTDGMTLSGTLTVTGTLTLNGNSAVNRLIMSSSAVGTSRTITAATVSVTNSDFQDIAGAGAGSWNLSAITGGSGDCGGNSGITFTTAAAQSWQGTAGGNWSDVLNWTSRVPLPQDAVTVNAAFSASQTITWDMPRLGSSVSFAGCSGSPTVTPSLAISVFGSLTFTGVGALSVGSGTSFTYGGRSSYTVTMGGLAWARTINFQGGTYTLQDAFTSTGPVNVLLGTFNSNNQTITADSFQANGTGVVANIGTSTLNLTTTTTGSVLIRTGGATFAAGAATVNITAAAAITRNISVTGMNLSSMNINYTVAGSTGALALSTPCTLGTITFSDASNARTLYIVTGATASVGGFNVVGTAGKLMSVLSCNGSFVGTPGTTHTLSKTSGAVAADYLNLQDSTVIGGASWYAGANSTNVSNNSGWFFMPFSPSRFLQLC